MTSLLDWFANGQAAGAWLEMLCDVSLKAAIILLAA